MNTVLSAVNPRYISWTSSVYKDFDSFHLYASQIFNFLDRPIDLLLDSIDIPVLLIVGDEDRTVNYKTSEYISSLIPSSKLIILPECDHFALHSESSLAKNIKKFIQP